MTTFQMTRQSKVDIRISVVQSEAFAVGLSYVDNVKSYAQSLIFRNSSLNLYPDKYCASNNISNYDVSLEETAFDYCPACDRFFKNI